MITCFDLPVKILNETETHYTVKYEDDVEETVKKDLVDLGYTFKTRTPLRNKKPIKKVNSKRRKETFKKNFHSEERVLKIKAMKCIVSGCFNNDIVNAHMLQSRGAGGDYKGILPLCNFHHDIEHSIGAKPFLKKYGIDIEKEITRVRTELGEI